MATEAIKKVNGRGRHYFLIIFLIYSHQVQPCTKKMKKSEESFYEEKVFFQENFYLMGEKIKSFLPFSSSFVIVAKNSHI